MRALLLATAALLALATGPASAQTAPAAEDEPVAELEPRAPVPQEAIRAYGAGDHARALILLEQAIATCKPTPASPDACLDLLLSASRYALRTIWYEGQPALGEQWAREALALSESTLPSGHPDIATSLGLIGLNLDALGRKTEADQYWRRLLAIETRTQAPLDTEPESRVPIPDEVIRTFEAGDVEHALILLEKATVSCEPTLGPLEACLGLLLSASDFACHSTWRCDMGAKWAQEALALAGRTLPPNHPEISDILKEIGGYLEHYGFELAQEGRYTESDAFFQQAIAVYEKALPPHHSEIAKAIYYGLVWNLERQDRVAEAEPVLRRALAIYENEFPEDLEMIGSIELTIANSVAAQGKVQEAERFFRRAIPMVDVGESPAEYEKGIAERLLRSAADLMVEGRTALAEPLLRRALAIYEKALPPDHQEIATGLGYLAWNLDEQGRFAEAESLRRRELDLQVKRWGPSHEFVAPTLSQLGLNLFDQGRAKEAEPFLRRALPVLERTALYYRSHELILVRTKLAETILVFGGSPVEAHQLVSLAIENGILARIEKMRREDAEEEINYYRPYFALQLRAAWAAAHVGERQ